MMDFSKINKTPINHLALNFGMVILFTIIFSILVGTLLKMIKVPNSIINKLIGPISIIVLVSIFYFMDKWNLFVAM